MKSRYVIDAEAVARTADPLGLTLNLVAAITTPGWSQELECQGCLDWDSGRRKKRPRPPVVYKSADPTASCHGCAWSFLDRQDLLEAEERLGRLRLLERTWEESLPWIVRQHTPRRLEAMRLQIANCQRLIAELEAFLQVASRTKRGWIRHTKFEGNKPVKIGAHQ